MSETRRLSRKQEERMAADIGGRCQPASGALPGDKGDVRAVGHIRGEAKYTKKKQYTLHHADLRKLRAQSLMGGVEKPVFRIGFVEDQTTKRMDEYVVIPLDYFLE